MSARLRQPTIRAALALLGIAISTPLPAAPSQLEAAESAALSTDVEKAHQEGIALYRQGKIAEAEQTFRQVLKQAGRYIPARYDLGALLLNQGRMREGLAHYEFIAVKLLPQDPEAHHRCALVLNQARQTRAAITQLNKALELDD